MKDALRGVLWCVVGIAVCYIFAASAVFNLRHPWITDHERLVWMGSALTFDRVPYDVMRPRN